MKEKNGREKRHNIRFLTRGFNKIGCFINYFWYKCNGFVA